MRFGFLEIIYITPIEAEMKNELNDFEAKRNLYFKRIVLEADFKQNFNDLKHRNIYDRFIYKLIDSESGRKQYCKKFIVSK